MSTRRDFIKAAGFGIADWAMSGAIAKVNISNRFKKRSIRHKLTAYGTREVNK